MAEARRHRLRQLPRQPLCRAANCVAHHGGWFPVGRSGWHLARPQVPGGSPRRNPRKRLVHNQPRGSVVYAMRCVSLTQAAAYRRSRLTDSLDGILLGVRCFRHDHPPIPQQHVSRTPSLSRHPGISPNPKRDLASLISSLIHPRTPTSIGVHQGSLSRKLDLRGRSCTVILNTERIPAFGRGLAKHLPGCHRTAARPDPAQRDGPTHDNAFARKPRGVAKLIPGSRYVHIATLCRPGDRGRGEGPVTEASRRPMFGRSGPVTARGHRGSPTWFEQRGAD